MSLSSSASAASWGWGAAAPWSPGSFWVFTGDGLQALEQEKKSVNADFDMLKLERTKMFVDGV